MNAIQSTPYTQAPEGTFVFKTLSLSEFRSTDESATKKFLEMMKDGFFYLEIPASCQELIPAGLAFAHSFYQSDLVKQTKLSGFGGYHDRSKDHLQIEAHYAERKDWRLLTEKQVYSSQMEKLAHEMNDLGVEILIKSLNALGIPKDKWDLLTGDLSANNGSHHFSFNHYRKELAGYLGLSEHRDYGYITVLYTDKPGLEGKINGVLQDVPPLKNYFIINFGKSLEIMTNHDNRINAIEHRVRMMTEDRTSFGVFLDGHANRPLYSYNFQTQGVQKEFESYEDYMKGEFTKVYKQTKF